MPDHFAIFAQTFRCHTAAKEVRILFKHPPVGKSKDKDVVYLGRTSDQTFFNEIQGKERGFYVAAQSKVGLAAPEKPRFVFDISAYRDKSDYLFLDSNFQPIKPCSCVEVGREKCGDCCEMSVCEQKMYLVFKDDKGKVKMEEWEVQNDTRFYHSAGMLRIRKFDRGSLYLTLRKRYLRGH